MAQKKNIFQSLKGQILVLKWNQNNHTKRARGHFRHYK